MADEDLTARLRATGQAQFSRSMRTAATDVGSIGSAAGRISGRGFLSAASGARRLGSEARSTSSSIRAIATGVAAYKIAGTIGDAVGQGFAYNKMIDGQNVAFTTLLGSQKRSADFMAQIQALALKSPVLDPQSTGDAARLLMAYGMSARKTLPMVEALGDMSAATGKSIAETMPRGAMALGQIAGKGKLQTEEMNQLAESVGLGREKIRKALDMTREDFADAFKPGGEGITASKALPAILDAMRKSSGGAAERLSKTSAGKMDRLREVFKKAMGGLTRDLYDARGNVAGALASIIQDRDLNFGEKVAASRRAVAAELGPLADTFTGWWRREHVGELIGAEVRRDAPKVGAALGDAVRASSPVVMSAMSAIAPQAASAFVDAFKAAPAWAQVLTVGLIAKKLGVFSTLGRMAAGRMCTSVGSKLPGCIEGKMKATSFAGTARAMAGGLAVSLPAAIVAAGLAGVVMAALLPTDDPSTSAESGNTEGVRAHHVVKPGTGKTGAQIWTDRQPDPGRGGSRDPAGIGSTPVAPLPSPFARKGVAPQAPRGRGALLNVHVVSELKGREVGRGVARITADDLRKP